MSLNVDDLPQRMPLSGVTNAAGICTITFRAPGQIAWQVEQITTEMRDAPSGSAGFLRVNDSSVSDFISTSDVIGGDPPLPVYPGDVVEIEWTGATPGSQGRALVIYRTASYAR